MPKKTIVLSHPEAGDDPPGEFVLPIFILFYIMVEVGATRHFSLTFVPKTIQKCQNELLF